MPLHYTSLATAGLERGAAGCLGLRRFEGADEFGAQHHLHPGGTQMRVHVRYMRARSVRSSTCGRVCPGRSVVCGCVGARHACAAALISELQGPRVRRAWGGCCTGHRQRRSAAPRRYRYPRRYPRRFRRRHSNRRRRRPQVPGGCPPPRTRRLHPRRNQAASCWRRWCARGACPGPPSPAPRRRRLEGWRVVQASQCW